VLGNRRAAPGQEGPLWCVIGADVIAVCFLSVFDFFLLSEFFTPRLSDFTRT
jgi:hypothetical protein